MKLTPNPRCVSCDGSGITDLEYRGSHYTGMEVKRAGKVVGYLCACAHVEAVSLPAPPVRRELFVVDRPADAREDDVDWVRPLVEFHAAMRGHVISGGITYVFENDYRQARGSYHYTVVPLSQAAVNQIVEAIIAQYVKGPLGDGRLVVVQDPCDVCGAQSDVVWRQWGAVLGRACSVHVQAVRQDRNI